MFREYYRNKFKLTSEQMDNEPAEEVAVYAATWKLRQLRKKLEEKRSG